VNLRALMVVHKMEGHTVFKLNDNLIAVLFFVFRILYYPFMTYRMIYAFRFLDVSKG
jgi:uncharacterized MAPEG superfamily protein